LQPISVPALRRPPREPDVVGIGAGAAGIAAARACLAAGLTVAVVEARPRIGGRAVTVALAGHPVDLGAHWLHAGAINPLLALGRARGEPLRPAATGERQLFIEGRPATPAERQAYVAAWERAERAYREVSGPDRSFAEVVPPLGRWQKAIESTEILLSGRPLDEVSFADQPDDSLYAENHFVAGGYGAYLARLAEGLPIVTGCAASALDWSGPGVALATAAGTMRARAAILAIPVGVLAQGALAFSPRLPDDFAEAVACFRIGTYEHIVLHWPKTPFSGADRFATLVGEPFGGVSLLTHIDGSALHYIELNHDMAEALARHPGGAPAFAAELLGAHFSAAELAGSRVLHATDWRRDPLALGGWSVLPAGAKGVREMLKRPLAERVWFVGEALAGPQWGTVGGAWEQGERAAAEVATALR
jgi:monoamine oxidase